MEAKHEALANDNFLEMIEIYFSVSAHEISHMFWVFVSILKVYHFLVQRFFFFSMTKLKLFFFKMTIT